jgi:hypothetical protein
VRRLQFTPHVQFRLATALARTVSTRKLRGGGDAGGIVKMVRGLVDPPAGFALKPGD